MKHITKLFLVMTVLGGLLAGCSSEGESPTTDAGATPTSTAEAGKDNNPGGAAPVGDAMAAPPGVKTGTP